MLRICLLILCVLYGQTIYALEATFSGNLFFAPVDETYIKGEDIGDSYVKFTLDESWKDVYFHTSMLSRLYENEIGVSELYVAKQTDSFGWFALGRLHIFNENVYNAMSYPWLSLPREVNPLDVTSYEGFQWRHDWDKHHVRFVSGRTDNNEFGTNLLNMVIPYGLEVRSKWDYFTTKFAFAETRVDLSGQSLTGIQNNLVGLPNTVVLEDKKSYYYDAVVTIPIRPVIFSFKYSQVDYVEEQYTVFDGYRLRAMVAVRPEKSLTLYYTYGESEAQNDFSAISDQLPTAAAALSKSLTEKQYHSHHLGMVKNISKNVKLKFQSGLAKSDYSHEIERFILLGFSFDTKGL
ncbi:hypothetical protein GCM10007938_17080 [Vibrio zhanjiangensis]|uniref:Uncharacterized protein n=1 Tax=Vibrio zhanjiangensis TaxID=1046128 RepID=A0ABQ6EZI4_9VIBR|nr:hypothetical protein [Vibrio zhanjiangensis]GLT17930.1 hypothetical protein GCM10007938_17080 [Vibrio zhanjiangensis]